MEHLDIEYWDYDDGTVGAKFEQVDGDIFAVNEQVLMQAIVWLASKVQEEDKRAREAGNRQRKLDIGMQGAWIDGAFTVRFLPLRGFGVSFTCTENLQKWLSHLIVITTQPKTND